MIPRIFSVLLLLACIIVNAGCMIPFGGDNQTADASESPVSGSVANYKVTIAQPEESARMIRMDTDVYNIGEVVEFVIVNEKSGDLSCTNDPPSFSVRYQMATGRWIDRMGQESPADDTAVTLKPGESTAPYRFITTGWAPGRYRIVTDCGVSREILLRALPPLSPTGIPCTTLTRTAPFIQVNTISNQYPGTIFTITGTTNLPAGEELRYSIFAILPSTGNITSARLVSNTVRVSAGTCGVNTWSVDGKIDVPGDYFIGISNNENTVSAVRRFTVLEEARATTTATLPERTKAPGIMTG